MLGPEELRLLLGGGYKGRLGERVGVLIGGGERWLRVLSLRLLGVGGRGEEGGLGGRVPCFSWR